MLLFFYELTSLVYNLEEFEVEKILEEQEKRDIEEFYRRARVID